MALVELRSARHPTRKLQSDGPTLSLMRQPLQYGTVITTSDWLVILKLHILPVHVVADEPIQRRFCPETNIDSDHLVVEAPTPLTKVASQDETGDVRDAARVVEDPNCARRRWTNVRSVSKSSTMQARNRPRYRTSPATQLPSKVCFGKASRKLVQ